MVWYGVVQYAMVGYSLIWCFIYYGMVWYGVVWYGMVYIMVWFGRVWCGVVWYGMVWWWLCRAAGSVSSPCSLAATTTAAYILVTSEKGLNRAPSASSPTTPGNRTILKKRTLVWAPT